MELILLVKGEYLFHEGDESNLFYGVIKGKISFRKTNIIKKNINKKYHKKIKIKNSNDTIKITQNNNNENKVVNNIFINKKEILKRKKIYNEETKNLTLINTFGNLILKIDNNIKIKQEEIIEKYEEELFQKGEGYCFGDWGLLYHQNRTCSVYALEDTYLFSLNFEDFEKSFYKCLEKSDKIKRAFIKENLFPFPISSNDYSMILYNNIIPINCNKNQKIISEGEKAKYIYIIYLGEFILKKKIYNETSKEYKEYKILTIGKGGIIGLESLFNQNCNYNFSLYSSNSSNTFFIFSINTEKIPLNLLSRMKNHLRENYEKFISMIKNIIEKQIIIRKKLNKERSLPILFTDNEKYQNLIHNYLKSKSSTKNTQNNFNKQLINDSQKKSKKAKLLQPFKLYKKQLYKNNSNSNLLSTKNNSISRNLSMKDLSEIKNKINKKKIKNISLNCSFLINKNIKNQFKLRKHLSQQKMISRETKFSSKDYSSFMKEQSNKNLNRNNSESVFELQKNINNQITENNNNNITFNNKKNLIKENKNVIGTYYSGHYNLPLFSILK